MKVDQMQQFGRLHVKGSLSTDPVALKVTRFQMLSSKRRCFPAVGGPSRSSHVEKFHRPLLLVFLSDYATSSLCCMQNIDSLVFVLSVFAL